MKLTNWAGALLIVLAATLYLGTLDNGLRPDELEGGDLITHQYAQVQARPSNAPGYPLYTMGGWLWFHGMHSLLHWLGEPYPNPIPILSSYSTLWALLSLWLLYKILCHTTRSPQKAKGNWPIAWLLTAFYAVTYFFWYYATTTEQYSSAIAHTLAIVYLYLLWRESVKIGKAEHDTTFLEDSRPFIYLTLLAFLCGLSLAHMLTVAFIVPPLVFVILWEFPHLLKKIRVIIACLIAATFPLLSYGYVYIRGAAHPEWWGEGDWSTAQEWFWAFLSTAQGRDELGWGFEPGRAFFGNGFPELIWQELTIPIAILGLFGIIWVNRHLSQILYGTLLIYILFCWAYRYGNWFQVILPAYPLLLIGVAALAERLQSLLNRRISDPQIAQTEEKESVGKTSFFVSLAQFLPHILLFFAIFWRFDASWPAADSRNQSEDSAFDQAILLLDQPLPQNANLFAPVTELHALQYLIDIWDIRPDLQIVSRLSAAQKLSQNEIVLSTWDITPRLLEELPPALQPSIQSATPDWALLQIAPNSQAIEPDVLLGQELVPGITLIGYTTRNGPTGRAIFDADPTGLDVILFWQIEENGWPEGLSISVRPTEQGLFIPNPATEDGAIFQEDVSKPARGLLHLGNLPAPQPVMDAYRFALPIEMLERVDGLMLILYRQNEGGFENLYELRLPVQ